jgi:hypothetical protein
VRDLNHQNFHKDHSEEEGDHSHVPMPEIKVACINLAYDNSSILRLLSQRGKHLTHGEFKKAKAVETKILQELETNSEKVKRPVVAFVIFETFEC